MGLVYSHYLDFAELRPPAARDRQSPGPTAGSGLPRRGGAGFLLRLRGIFSLVDAVMGASWIRGGSVDQRLTAGRRDRPSQGGASARALSWRAPSLDALARVNAAVRADQLIAGRCRSRGDLRPT